MIKAFLLVTILTTHLTASDKAYREHLFFKPLENTSQHTGVISSEEAQILQSPELAGKRFKILQAASGKPAYLRFIEVEKSFLDQQQRRGWRAMELLANNVDQLSRDLKDSPFREVGKPAWISAQHNVKAMQANGPNGELIYFSQVIDPAKMLLTKVQAQSVVDRPFIMVAGGNEFAAAQSWYRDTFGAKVLGPFPYRIDVVATRLQLPLDNLFDLSLVAMTPEFSLELDHYPANAKDVQPNPIFAISLLVTQWPQVAEENPASASFELNDFPFNHRRVALLEGKLGERLEIVLENHDTGAATNRETTNGKTANSKTANSKTTAKP